jgi:hypothetical protein
VLLLFAVWPYSRQQSLLDDAKAAATVAEKRLQTATQEKDSALAEVQEAERQKAEVLQLQAQQTERHKDLEAEVVELKQELEVAKAKVREQEVAVAEARASHAEATGLSRIADGLAFDRDGFFQAVRGAFNEAAASPEIFARYGCDEGGDRGACLGENVTEQFFREWLENTSRDLMRENGGPLRAAAQEALREMEEAMHSAIARDPWFWQTIEDMGYMADIVEEVVSEVADQFSFAVDEQAHLLEEALAKARSAKDSAQRLLDERTAQVASTQSDLDRQRAALEATERELGKANASLSAATDQLAQAEARLSEARTSARAAEANLKVANLAKAELEKSIETMVSNIQTPLGTLPVTAAQAIGIMPAAGWLIWAWALNLARQRNRLRRRLACDWERQGWAPSDIVDAAPAAPDPLQSRSQRAAQWAWVLVPGLPPLLAVFVLLTAPAAFLDVAGIAGGPLGWSLMTAVCAGLAGWKLSQLARGSDSNVFKRAA